MPAPLRMTRFGRTCHATPSRGAKSSFCGCHSGVPCGARVMVARLFTCVTVNGRVPLGEEGAAIVLPPQAVSDCQGSRRLPSVLGEEAPVQEVQFHVCGIADNIRFKCICYSERLTGKSKGIEFGKVRSTGSECMRRKSNPSLIWCAPMT